MQIQSYNSGLATKNTKTETRCPHGASPGACPACSGGGGGGGSAKKAGLMSWNEAFAVWNAIQVAETRKKDYLQGAAAQQERQQHETQIRAIRNLAMAMLGSMSRGLPPGLATIMPIAATAMKNGLEWLANLPRNLATIIQQRLAQGLQPIIDISGKIASLLGDIQNRLDDIWHHNGEVLKSLLAQLQWEQRMGQVQSLLKRVLGQFGPRQIFRAIEQRVKSLFGKILGLFGQQQEPLEEVSD